MIPVQQYKLNLNTVGSTLCCDIENDELIYSDMGKLHGLQCNHIGGTETHEKIKKLASQISELTKEMYLLNKK